MKAFIQRGHFFFPFTCSLPIKSRKAEGLIIVLFELQIWILKYWKQKNKKTLTQSRFSYLCLPTNVKLLPLQLSLDRAEMISLYSQHSSCFYFRFRVVILTPSVIIIIIKKKNFANQVYLKNLKSSAHKLHKLTKHKYQRARLHPNQSSSKKGEHKLNYKKFDKTKVTFQLSNLLKLRWSKAKGEILSRWGWIAATLWARGVRRTDIQFLLAFCKQPLKHHLTQLCGTCRYFPFTTWTIRTEETWETCWCTESTSVLLQPTTAVKAALQVEGLMFNYISAKEKIGR